MTGPMANKLTDDQRLERTHTIHSMIEAGDTAVKIAAELHCSLSEVYRVSKITGTRFARRRMTSEERLEIARYYQSHTIEQTRTQFGVSAPTILKAAKLLGITKDRGVTAAGDVLTKLNLRIARDIADDYPFTRVYSLVHIPTGRKLFLDYSTDVLKLRKDPVTWLKTNAQKLNIAFRGH